jgi:hypothetical protein
MPIGAACSQRKRKRGASKYNILIPGVDREGC